jgi:hypothetical protein
MAQQPTLPDAHVVAFLEHGCTTYTGLVSRFKERAWKMRNKAAGVTQTVALEALARQYGFPNYSNLAHLAKGEQQ